MNLRKIPYFAQVGKILNDFTTRLDQNTDASRRTIINNTIHSISSQRKGNTLQGLVKFLIFALLLVCSFTNNAQVVTKQLYLSDQDQSLDRIHPGLVIPVDNTTSTSESLVTSACGPAGPFVTPNVPFSTPTDISQQFGGHDALTPDVDVYINPATGEETIHMVFLGKANSETHDNIYYSKKIGTGNWTSPVLISNDSWADNTEEFPSIKVDANNKVHVAYSHRKNSGSPQDNNRNIYYVTNASGSWDAPIRISDDGFNENADTPEIALDANGKAYVAYAHKNSGDSNTNIYYVSNVSGTWSSSVRISNDGFGNDVGLNPAIAVDANNIAHVTYSHKNSSDLIKNIYYVNNIGGSWSTPQRISRNNAGNDVLENSSIAMDEANEPHVVYSHKDASWGDVKPNIYYTNKVTGSWSSPVDLSNDKNGQESLDPTIAVSCTGIVRVAFSNKGEDIYYTEKNTSWSALIDLNPVTGGSNTKNTDGDFPSIAITPDNVHLVFNDRHVTIGGKIEVWHTSAPLGFEGESSTIFTQTPVMCSNLSIPNGSTVNANLHILVAGAPVSGSTDISAVLRYDTTTIANLSNAGYTGGTDGMLTLSGTLSNAITVPAGKAIELEITNNENLIKIAIQYDSQDKPSKIELSTSTFIDINSYAVYDAPYPGGNIITNAAAGDIVYPRAVVSDPFGYTDITGLEIDISGSPVSASSVATSGCMRTYEYVWNTTGLSGSYSIPATAHEGYENTVTDVQPLSISICSPVIGTPIFTLGATSNRCVVAESITYAASSSDATGLTYSLDASSLAAGNTINSATGEVTYGSDYLGTSTITATAEGCGGPISATHTATTNGELTTPVFAAGASSTRCQAVDTIVYSATSEYPTDITYTLDATSISGGNTINASNGEVTYASDWSGTSVITVTVEGCGGPLSETHTVTTNETIYTPIFDLGESSTRCQGAVNVSYAATSSPSAIMSYSLDTTSLAGSNTINTSTGVVTYDENWYGTSIITVTATGCDGPLSATHTVTIEPSVGAPVFTSGTSSQRCKGAGIVTYAADAVNTTGITYSLDAASLSAGNSINASTGQVNYVSGWSGTAIITASAAGCGGPKIQTHTAITVSVDAIDDAATGNQGVPLQINVLDNDLCEFNSASLSLVAEPANGNVQVGMGGLITYLPNGNFVGDETFTYQICSYGPTVECDIATVTLTILETYGDPCSEATTDKLFYLPYPENESQVRKTLRSAGNTNLHTDSVQSVTSIKMPYPGTVIIYDHWEDGYESDINLPEQSTTLVWGDGNSNNGIAPGYPADIIPSGGYIVLNNTFNYNPRNPADIYYDGKDKMLSSNDIAVSKYVGDQSEINVQSLKTNVEDITRFGQLFVIPFGENNSGSNFGNTSSYKYAAAYIRAAKDGTIVNLDYDGDNIIDVTQNLNEGDVWVYDGTASQPGNTSTDINNANDIKSGGIITSNYDVGVDMVYGDIANYGTRNFPILPGAYYSDSYVTPVYTSVPTGSVPIYIFFTNTLNTDNTVNWTSATSSGSVIVPANGSTYYELPTGVASGYKFESASEQSFGAIAIIDADDDGLGYDWAFKLTSEERLTKFTSIAWAPGSSDLTQNYNPIWVTPTANTTIYIKHDGDITSTTPPMSPCGLPYDIAVPLNELESYRIFDNSDNTQTGTAIYTCDDVTFAAAWGQDAWAYGSLTPTGGSNVSMDIGYTLSPRCLQQLIFANDDLKPTLINTPVNIDVDINDVGFLCLVDPLSVSTTGLLPPANGSTVVNGDGTITYTPNPGFSGVDKFEYRICSSDVASLCDVARVRVPVTCYITTVGENDINGTVFIDDNLDTDYSVGENGQSGVTVILYEDNNENGQVDGGDTQIDSYVTDASGNYSFSVALPPGSGGMVQSKVSQSSDDAEEDANGGTPYLNSSDLELVTDGSPQIVGMRFQNINIPEGAIITSAYIQFETDETSNGTTNLSFYGEATDNATTFTTSTNNISGRPKTTSSVNWNNVPAWNTVSEKHSTPQLIPIIQEIVDRPGWVSNNSLVILVEGSGARIAESFNGESDNAPKIIIEYSLLEPVSYVVAVNPASLPTNYSFTTDNLEMAVFTDSDISDCENNFGIVNLCTHASETDTDGDGFNDICDLDDDNDGILDTDECSEPTPCDTDMDGIPDHLDLDSDNDGCTDADEAYGTESADNDDGGIYGPGIPTLENGLVDENGLVISAGVTGSTYNTTPAVTPGGRNTFQEAIVINLNSGLNNTEECVGSTATFNAVATTIILATNPTTTASTDVIYKWQLNGFDIVGATGTASSGSVVSYTTPSLTIDDNGNEYKVIFTNEASICGIESSAILTVHENPVCSVSNDGPICSGEDLNLMETGTGATSWLWTSNGSATFNNNTLQNPIVSGAVNGEIFTVVTTDNNGCQSSCQTTAVVYTIPVCSASNDGPICSGEDLNLNETGTGAVSWLWTSNGSATFDNNTIQNPVASGAVNGEIFTVQITNSSGCITTCQTTAVVNDLPLCNASNNGPICSGEDLNLSETGTDAVSWLWSSSEGATFNDNTLQNPVASGAIYGEIFTVQVTNSIGCSSICQTTAIVNTSPASSASNNGPINCTLTDVTLTALPAGMTYEWESGGTGQTETVDEPDTYYVTVTAANGCSSVTSTIVTEDTDDPIADAGSDLDICPGDSATLTATGGISYLWSNGAGNTSSVTVSPFSNTTYRVTVTAANGCTDEAEVRVNLYDLPNASISKDGDIQCDDSSVQLTASPVNMVYLWSTGDTTQLIDVMAAGTYTLTVTNQDECSNITQIVVDELIDSTAIFCERYRIRESGVWSPWIDFNGVCEIELCENNGSSDFRIDGGPDLNSGWVWRDESGNMLEEDEEEVQFNDLTVSDSGVYTAEYTNSYGCVSTLAINVTVHSNPNASATNDGPITCDQTSVELSALPNGLSYEWEDGATEQTTFVNNEDSYSVTVTDSNGCTDIASTVVTEDTNIPEAEAGNNQTICEGSSATLTASGGNTYQWSNGAGNSASVSVFPDTTTTYIVTVTADNGCQSTDEVEVFVSSEITGTIDFLGSVCLESETQITANVSGGTPNLGYSWSGPNAFSSNKQTIDVSESGNYYVTVTDDVGCTAEFSSYVYDSFEPFIFSLSTEVCEGEDVTLSVDSESAVAFNWGPNAGNVTTSSVTVTPSPPSTEYFVTVTNDEGCTAEVSANIDVHSNPIVNVTGPASICEGETTTLSPTTDGNWVSSDNAVATITNSGVVTGISAGTVNFTFTNSTTGCESLPSADITIKAKSPVSVTGPTSICEGFTSQLSPTTGGTWTSNNSSIASVTNDGVVTGISEGSTTFIFTNSTSGCASDASQPITVNDVPVVSITGSSVICVGSTTSLEPSSGGNWTSSNPSVATVSNSGIVTGINIGTATFTFTTSQGCVSDPTEHVTVDPDGSITISGDDMICEGETTQLTASSSGGTWSSGNTSIATIDSNGVVTAIAVGTVTITYEDNTSECISDPTFGIEIIETPTISISGSATICVGETTQLTTSGTGGFWTSSNSNIAVVSSAGTVQGISSGTVTFTYTNPNGCESSASETITVDNAVEVSIDFNGSKCLKDDSQLSAIVTGGTAGYNYSWTGPGGFTSDLQTVNITMNGDYFLTVTDSKGCSDNTIAIVHESYQPFIFALDTEVCEGEDLTLSVSSNTAATYQWGSNAGNVTTQSVTVTPGAPSTSYYVTVTNNIGCSSEAIATIDVNERPIVNITGPDDICQNETTQLSPSSGGSWTSSNYFVAQVTNSGLVSGIASGSATFTFKSNLTGCYSDPTTPITVNANETLTITGDDHICLGESTTLVSSVAGGTWSSSNTGVVEIDNFGEITSNAQGSAIITYTPGSGTCNSEGTFEIEVYDVPIINLSGPSTICEGEQTYLYASTSGVWTSSDPLVASISSFGVITGLSDGTATFSFVSDAGCPKTFETPIHVIGSPEISLDGPGDICVGATSALLPNSGGIWTSSNSNVATVDESGIVTGINEGVATFTFTEFTNGCVADSVIAINVYSDPTINDLEDDQLCIGEITSITPSSGGTWSSSNTAVAQITNSGQITAMGEGSATFYFTNSLSGCTSDASMPLVVNSNPTINFTGPTVICVGETSAISPASGGTWQSTNVAVATITSNGTITAIAPGEVQFIYTYSATGCTSVASENLTVAEPFEIEVTGPSVICMGSTTSLSPTSGGVWSSSDPNIASIANNGVVTGIAPGIVTFTFDSNTGCSSNPSSEITIEAQPVANITGSSPICAGSTTTLSPTSGGTWASNNPSIATVDNSGLVTGVAAGLVSFTFTSNATGCASATTNNLSVYDKPEIFIVGDDEICTGSTTNLEPTSGGTWISSNNFIASINSSGLVTGFSPGTVTFTFYEAGSGCVSDASQPITILPVPVVSITGDNFICVDETTTLSPSSGGSWVSNNVNVASVTEQGIVTGISQGIAKFTFISDEGCTSNQTAPVTVYARPTTAVDGPDVICSDDSGQMLPSSGGTWSSTNPTVATIDDNGVFTALSGGTVRFIFTNNNTGCSSEESDEITVHARPTVDIIGPPDICVGGSTNLVPTAGGTWISLDPDIATIQNNGEVQGISIGSTRFIFTNVSTGCVSDTSAYVNINDGADVYYTGPQELCIGETSSIYPSSGGIWTSTNNAIAMIDSNGVITAVGQGSVKFLYTGTDSGCPSELSETLVVHGFPTVWISGPSEICMGSSTTLSPSTGGTWTSLQSSIAEVDQFGNVTGISSGIADFVFVDSTTGCPSADTLSITILDASDIEITGDTQICLGYKTTLSPTSGGYWTSSNPDIATVTNSGIVLGKAPGVVTFEFTDAGTGCSSNGSTDPITVELCNNHDFNATLVDLEVQGNISTNDNVPVGTSYDGPKVIISKPAQSIATLNINPDGTYTFIANKEGKYIYGIPVCIPPITSGCPKTYLEINVVDGVYSHSNPIGNLDFATTYTNENPAQDGESVSIDAMANDDCIYTEGCDLDPSTLEVTGGANHGSTDVDLFGIITYTPEPEFIGKDTIFYTICVNGDPTDCSESYQIITVNHTSAANSTVAVDDFAYTLRDTPVSGNVITNDSDPEGDAISVIAQGSSEMPVSIAEGEYYIDPLGNFTFTPADGFSGSAEIIYTLCDDVSEPMCTNATLHLLVINDISIKLRVYLEGALMLNGGKFSSLTGHPLMRDNLRVSPFTGENYIPTTDPYSFMHDPFMDTPAEFTKLGPGLIGKNILIADSVAVFSVIGDNAIVDWVHVELRSKDDYTVPIATRSGLLQRDGDVVDLDGISDLRFDGVNVDSFYVVVKHRSHLGAMSMKVVHDQLVDFTDPDFPVFDFGTSLDESFDYTGLSQKPNVISGYNALWCGDFDSNGQIKFTNPGDDVNILFIDVLFNSNEFLINYDYAYGYLTGDFNMNSKAKYTNPDDDINLLFSQMLFYPLNTSFLSNFNAFIEQIPE